MWPKSYNIAVFALDLKSTYEEEHTIFGLLSLANLTQNDVLQFHPLTCGIPSFLMRSHYAAQADLKFAILLPPSPSVGMASVHHHV
jgi:hypothetical protein